MLREERIPLPFTLERSLDAVTCSDGVKGELLVAFRDDRSLRVERINLEQESSVTLARADHQTPRAMAISKADDHVFVLSDQGLLDIANAISAPRFVALPDALFASTLLLTPNFAVIANDYNDRCSVIRRDTLTVRGQVRFRALDLVLEEADQVLRFASLRDGRVATFDAQSKSRSIRGIDPRALAPFAVNERVYAIAATTGTPPNDVGTFTGLLGLEPTGHLVSFERASFEKLAEGSSLPVRKTFQGERTLTKILGLDGDGALMALASCGVFNQVITELVSFEPDTLLPIVRQRYFVEPIDLHLVAPHMAAGLSHLPYEGMICVVRWPAKTSKRPPKK